MSNDEEDFIEVTNDLVEAKILHVLGIYPRLSHSMLQVGIGTGLPPKIWRPVLDRLEKEGKIKQYDVGSISPSGRDQIYHIIEKVEKVTLVPEG